MARAVEGGQWEPIKEDLLKGSNLWFFIEEDIQGTIKSWNEFVKASGLKDSHGINGGHLEGENFDGAGVTRISNMPSKQELMARVAGGVKAVPTKLARVIKAPGNKLARAIKLAGETLPNE